MYSGLGLLARKVFWAAALFSLVCACAYVWRGDYYFKQSDQFYYLSLADSLRQFGVMRELIDTSFTVAPSANTGVALLMLPFSGGNLDQAMIPLSILYLLLHISTFFPLYAVLRHWGVSERVSALTLLLYFFSFPVTMFKIWPINEGPSFFLTAWFLYFFLLRPGSFLYALPAFFAPIFRIHLLVVEVVLLAQGLYFRKRDQVMRSLIAIASSAAGAALYRFLFPYEQKNVGHILGREGAFSYIFENIPAAFAHLFLPETLTQLASRILPAALPIWLGGLLLVLVCASFLFLRGERATREVRFFSLGLFSLTTLSLAVSLTIIARFYTLSHLWILLILLLAAEKAGRFFERGLVASLVFLNACLLGAFIFTGTTAESKEALLAVKALSAHAAAYPVVLYDDNFPLNQRQIYGYFRRPSAPVSEWASYERFQFLTSQPEAVKPFQGCRSTRFDHGSLALFHVRCKEGLEEAN